VRLGETIREKWEILDGKDESCRMSDSKLQGGSICLSKLYCPANIIYHSNTSLTSELMTG
jgi:hypothetical protein